MHIPNLQLYIFKIGYIDNVSHEVNRQLFYMVLKRVLVKFSSNTKKSYLRRYHTLRKISLPECTYKKAMDQTFVGRFDDFVEIRRGDMVHGHYLGHLEKA